jgi:molecular chaperone HscB
MTKEPATATPMRCTTCEALAQAPLACTDCHALLAHVQGADYFELFGLPRHYDIDGATLSQKYLAISRNIHPDRFATAGAEMQSFALRASAAVNRAFEVISHPHRRAEYLLETSGGKSSAQDKRVPQDLLSNVMMLREEIEGAKAAGDADTLARMRSQIEQDRRATQERIAALCAKLSADRSQGYTGETPVPQEMKDQLRMQLNAVKYLDNLLGQF